MSVLMIFTTTVEAVHTNSIDCAFMIAIQTATSG